jgi:hypothetical protein
VITAKVIPTLTPSSTPPPTQRPIVTSTSVPAPQTAPLLQIAYGSAQSGTIDNATPVYYYRFEGTKGDIVTIRMAQTSVGDLDSVLYLYFNNGSNQLVTGNDNETAGLLDAAITSFTLPETGTYLIIAGRVGAVNGRTAGNFLLTLKRE